MPTVVAVIVAVGLTAFTPFCGLLCCLTGNTLPAAMTSIIVKILSGLFRKSVAYYLSAHAFWEENFLEHTLFKVFELFRLVLPFV